ncbi:MAG: acetate kinase [Phascolarctobacterium sp.]|nr:acetate kinase [Phascolarctobacterium sp.]MBO5404080.1 acetate kinase [Phascolarctobacterium sp.]
MQWFGNRVYYIVAYWLFYQKFLFRRLIVIVFVINCGSSSLKYQLIDMKNENVMAKGLIERIGMDGSVLKHTPANANTIDISTEIPDHKVAIQLVIEALLDENHGVIKKMSEINAVGHRVVHGGERFTDSMLITTDVIKGIEACCEIAPLHNPPNLHGILACMELLPEVPQVAVFDTAFHQTMPKTAFLYGLPYEMYVKYGLRRYGFHGTSHRYVAQKAAEMMGEHMSDLRIITCHLGNGASLTAIKYGKSVDTSMGYTPLEGLIMGTRSGEIDPAIIPFLMEKENMDAMQIDNFLNRRSGILGISGLSSDFRDLEAAANNGDERSQLAIDVFAYKVKKYIGGYVAAMGGVDAIVFTAGLGENSPFMREKICNGLEYLGTRIDPELNKIRGKAREISIKRARTKIFVIPTNEELVIARDTKRICRRIIDL